MRYLFLLTMLLMPFMNAVADDKLRTISVSGEAEIRIAPDQVIISMAVINKEQVLDVAKQANDKTVKALIAYFTETLKIDSKHVQTDYLSVSPVYFSCSNKDEQKGVCDPLKIQYHHLEKGIQVRVDDLTKYEAVIAKSFALGVNKINDIQFTTTELRKHKDNARELATLAAKEKAEAAADTLGMTLGKPITINLNNVDWFFSRNSNTRLMTQNVMQNAGGAGIGSEGSSLAVGQIKITASVNASFDME